MGTKVPLGELRTDDQGRLIVLGHFGTSASYLKKPAAFANNDGWHDDTSDGWCDSHDRRQEAGGGAGGRGRHPAQLRSRALRRGDHVRRRLRPVLPDTKFTRRPDRRSGGTSTRCSTGWVNSGADVLFGPGHPSHLTTPELLTQLADPGAEFQALPHRVRRLVRWPRRPRRRPRSCSYSTTATTAGSASTTTSAVAPTQYHWLPQWAAGDFDPDPSLRQRPATLARRLPARGPATTISRAAWVVRSTPHRRSLNAEGVDVEGAVTTTWSPRAPRPKMDYGDPGPGGARRGGVDLGPGTLTWWMGVPWQTDKSGQAVGLRGGHLPPAAVVLGGTVAQPALVRAADGHRPADHPTAEAPVPPARLAAVLRTRMRQHRPLHQLGIVTAQPGPMWHPGGDPGPGLGGDGSGVADRVRARPGTGEHRRAVVVPAGRGGVGRSGRPDPGHRARGAAAGIRSGGCSAATSCNGTRIDGCWWSAVDRPGRPPRSHSLGSDCARSCSRRHRHPAGRRARASRPARPVLEQLGLLSGLDRAALVASARSGARPPPVEQDFRVRYGRVGLAGRPGPVRGAGGRRPPPQQGVGAGGVGGARVVGCARERARGWSVQIVDDGGSRTEEADVVVDGARAAQGPGGPVARRPAGPLRPVGRRVARTRHRW